MPYLTLNNLDINQVSYADWPNVRKGQELFSNDRTTMIEFTGETARVHVLDGRQAYTVVLEGRSKSQALSQCNCNTSGRPAICKHIVAAIYETRAYIENEADDLWTYRLGIALENTPVRKKAIRQGNLYYFFFGFEEVKMSDGSQRARLVPYKLMASELALGADGGPLKDADELLSALNRANGWQRGVEIAVNSVRIYDCANLAPETMQFYNLMFSKDDSVRYYHQQGFLEFAHYLPFIGERQIPIYRISARGVLRGRIVIVDTPVTIEAAMTRSGDHLDIQAGVTVGGRMYSTAKNNLSVISLSPEWILAGDNLCPVANPEALDFMRFFPLSIPKEEETAFRERFFQPLAERLPISGDVVSWKEINSTPAPRLYLEDQEGQLMANLVFAYPDETGGEMLLEADPKANPVAVFDLPGSWTMMRVHRQMPREAFFSQLLTEAKYGLKRAGREYGPGTYELRARTHPLDFLMHAVPELIKAGFEIFGEDKIKQVRINRSIPTLRLSVSSGIDWFELNALLEYGDQKVTMIDVRKALRKGDNYIKLADGSIGQIPQEMIERYKLLFDLGSETETGLRVTDFHLPLVDELLQDARVNDLPADYAERRNRLAEFKEIKEQTLPVGFNGVLRPYQKAGYDWLHFLFEYGFGGCLADDMGLGKTIQVLAFLQSLYEFRKANKPTMLVVPKSLIANWQREAERFTPDLKILQFVGNTRKKDPAYLEDYQIVLTTYGTMLRDVEFLRSYNFAYIVLDESQAIKNPLAQSTKAARLLKADHRLVMTGTPVENNTFELWSQFAFINPGLLGGVDYFKREFSNPIEVEQNAQTAESLRKLIHPFILRRTKEQVAPELPERTERVIYTDLGPAQRKIYQNTRDKYRRELMDLIDGEGMNQARMKILEGLLRLRQTCIHPVLADPTYRGESAKFDLLFDTLETLTAEKHKALIFSQFVETLKLVRKELDLRKFTYAYLDGQTKDRQEQVDLFQTDPKISFFLLSLKAGGVGLNLTAADYVLHLDPWWNPAVEMQAADRAHRIGQDKPVFIYKFIARDTVEEKILQLQERKKELVEQIVSTEGSFFKSITPDDVRSLFS